MTVRSRGRATRALSTVPGLPAARRGARVLATDLAPVMIERHRARARREGLDRLEARVMDGCDLDLPDDAFGLVASQHGASLFPEPDRGLREMARVAVPGGRALIVAFGPLEEAEFLTLFGAALRQVVPDAPVPSPDAPPLPFQFADGDHLASAMEHAGFGEVSVTRVRRRSPVPSAQVLVNFVASSNPIGAAMVSGLPDARRVDLLAALQELLDARDDGSGPPEISVTLNVGVGGEAAHVTRASIASTRKR